jgi:hypothetical protein
LGYGIFAEPVTSGTRQQWIDLANKAVARIRKIDSHHIIFVERLYGEFGTRREMSGLDLNPEHAFFLMSDPNVVYQFYFFERDEYTHQHAPWREDRDNDVPYPDARFEIVYREAVNDRGRIFPFGRNYLKFYLERQLEFGAKHKEPMFVWSFGLMKNCFQQRGGLQWLRDTVSLFGEHNSTGALVLIGTRIAAWTISARHCTVSLPLSNSVNARVIESRLRAPRRDRSERGRCAHLSRFRQQRLPQSNSSFATKLNSPQ